LSTLFYKLF